MRTGAAELPGRHRLAGLTLIEISLLIALLSLSALYLVEHYAADAELQSMDDRLVGTVTDVWGLVDATRAWYAANSRAWPNITDTSSSTGKRISLTRLQADHYLRDLPGNRYNTECGGGTCPGQCADYSVTGWDASASSTTSTTSVSAPCASNSGSAPSAPPTPLPRRSRAAPPFRPETTNAATWCGRSSARSRPPRIHARRRPPTAPTCGCAGRTAP